MKHLVGRVVLAYLAGLVLTGLALYRVGTDIAYATLIGPLSDLSGDAAGRATGPLLFLGLGAAAFFIAEFSRRGSWGSRDRGMLQGGSVTVSMRRPLAPGWLVLWIIVCTLVVIALVVPPIVLAPTTLAGETDFAAMVAMYAALAGATGGAIAGSLVKKLVPKRPRRQGAASPAAQWLSGRWRGELWLMALAGAALAVLPVALTIDSAALVVVTVIVVPVGVVLSIVAIVAVRRAGVDDAALESFG